MKQQSRSILLSILLTLALVIGLVPGMGLTAYADEHTHDFEYSASGDTITATCKNEEMTNAGTYYVWYKIEGGRNYTSTAPQKLTVTIGQATPTILSAPMASAISYGQSLEDSIIAGGEPSVDGTVEEFCTAQGISFVPETAE